MTPAIVLLNDVPGFIEVLLKLGLAALLGGIIGWEREHHGRPAGVRTHMLIVVGCALFTEISSRFGGADPARIAAQVVTGVGFLGAGAIMRRGGEVRGLTTAASVWLAAAIGMAVGVGGDMYLVAVTATLLAVLTLGALDILIERVSSPRSHCELEVQLHPGATAGSVFAAMDAAGAVLNRSRRTPDPEGDLLVIVISGSRPTLDRAIDLLAALPEVKSVAREHA